MISGSAGAVDARLAESWRQAGWWVDQPLLERYQAHVDSASDGLAVVDDSGLSYTHEQLWGKAVQQAARLNEITDEGRHVVLCWLPNIAEYQVWFLAILLAGQVPCTVPATTDPMTLSAMLETSRARVLVCEADAISGAASAAERSPWKCTVLSSSLDASDLVTVDGDDQESHTADLAHVMFTSSTTGEPKGVMHTEQTLAAMNIGFTDRFLLSADSPIFMPSPLGHSVGGIHGIRLALHLGAPLVLQRRWDPQRAMALVDQYACAFTAAATPFLKDLVDTPHPSGRTKFDTMRTFLCGGAQVPPALLDVASSELPATFVTVLWGMTEGGVTTCVPGDDLERVRETAGCGLPGLELQVVDADGRPLPTGHEGELVMRGPGVFRGYLGRNDLYESLLISGGFFRTGDRAVLDDQDYLRVTGRIKDLVVRGGVNVSPVPIENALFRHPEVQAVAVIGMPDERLGERLCAVIKGSRDLSLDEVVRWCAGQELPKRLWPEHVVMVDDVPVTAAGKIRKHVLRERLFDQRNNMLS